MNKLSASDRSLLLKLAASLPQGNDTRRAVLAGLRSEALSTVLLNKYTKDANISTEIAFDLVRRNLISRAPGNPPAWLSLEEKERLWGVEDAQHSWKQSRDVFHVREEDVTPELKERLEFWASKFNLKLVPGFKILRLSSR